MDSRKRSLRRDVLCRGVAVLLCCAAACTPSSSAAPSRARPAGSPLQPCPVNAFRQFRCGVAAGAACPARSTELLAVSYPRAYEPDPQAESLDPVLVRAYRGEPGRLACCYSSCVPLEVRAKAASAHPYRSLACVPELCSSHPAPGHPGCPIAIQFPDDWLSHVAAFDEAGTREYATRAAAELGIAGIRWCCYGRAPAGAIGPM